MPDRSVDIMTGVQLAVGGTPWEKIPERCQSEAVRAVCELKQNYDELWKSHEMMDRQAPPSAVIDNTKPRREALINLLQRTIQELKKEDSDADDTVPTAGSKPFDLRRPA